MQRISQAIEAIRPVFENVNGAVAEQNETTSEMSDNAASASHFIVSVGDSAAEIDSATKEAEAHGESVAKAGKDVTTFAQKLKSRCAVLLRQGGREDPRKRERLPCNLKIEIQTARGLITAAVYEIAMEGILICGPEAERLPRNETLHATVESIGACRIRIGEQSKAGAQARFERPDEALSELIEDKLWLIRDENTEFVTRAMEAGAALTKIFEDAVKTGAISMDDMFDEDYIEIAGTNPVQHRTRILAGRISAAAVPGSLPRQGPAHGFQRHDRPQRLSAGAQQYLFASATPRRRRLEYRQLPQTAASSTIP